MLRLDDAPPAVRAGPPAANTHETRDRLNTAWLDAQVASYESVDYEQRAAVVAKRLIDGDAWFAAHGPDDPQYEAAVTLRGALMREQRLTAVTGSCLLMRCWTACTATYVLLHALPHTDRGVWVCLHMQGIEGRIPEHPIEIWRLLMGARPAPAY